MALVVANETYLADLILPFVDVFQMGRVEMMSRAGRGACEIIALRLQEPRPGRAGCGPTVVRDDEPQSHAYLCLCLLSRREAVRRGGALAAGPLHSVVADARGRVWSFGHGAHGRLGLGGSWLSACTPRPVELPSRVRVAQVAAAHRHSVALDVLGRAYPWGSDEVGQLGHGGAPRERAGPRARTAEPRTAAPRLVDQLFCGRGQRCVEVAAGDEHTLFLASDGRVRASGSASRAGVGPSLRYVGGGAYENEAAGAGPITAPTCAPTLLWRLADDAVIVKVAACGAHSLALDAEGRVFSWGDGDGGRLGHGDDAGKAEPTLISALAGTRATHVGCGAECSCVVTEAPELFWFGAENGLSYVTDFVEAETDGLLCWRLPTACPRALPGARGAAPRVVGVVLPVVARVPGRPRRRRRRERRRRRRRAAGAALRRRRRPRAAVVIVDGAAHQLCRDGTGAFSRRRLALPAPAVAAACSDEHYLVLTDDGDVHSAGNGGHGRLGHGSHTSNQDPKRIDALNRDG
ncbi:hypothetical protein JL720_1560 [Aureococcus anophagefferens]|nr:hypothetical protein JL720_1560 [Aureococcus anophagefferens]